MTTKIGGIIIDVDARLTKMEAALAKADKDFSRFERNVKAQGASVEKSLSGIDKGFVLAKASLAGFVASLGVGALAAFGKRMLDFADDLATAADQAGVGVERFQTLKGALRELEIDGAKADRVFKVLQSTLGEVQSGADNAATKALDRLGITADIMSGKISTSDQLLDALAAASKRAGTEAQFAADLVEIFGKRIGVDLAAAIGDGGAALARGEKDLRDYGAVLTEEMVDRLADANEKIDFTLQQAEYHFAIFAANSIESIQKVIDWYNKLPSAGQIAAAATAVLNPGAFIGSQIGAAIARGPQKPGPSGTENQQALRQALAAQRQAQQRVAMGEDAMAERDLRLANAQVARLRGAVREEKAKNDRTIEPPKPRAPEFPQRLRGSGGAGRSRTAAPKRDDFWDNKNTSLAFSAEHDVTTAVREMGLDMQALEPVARTLDEISADLVRMQGEIPEIGSMLSPEDRQELLRFSDTFNHSLSQGLTDAIIYGKDLGDVLEDTFKRAAAAMLESGILSLLTGGQQGTSFSTMFGNLFGGGRASGGPVDPSRFYVVGENGPELFSPGARGSIIPNFDGTKPGMSRGGAGDVLRVVVDKSDLFNVHVQRIGAEQLAQVMPGAMAATRDATIRTLRRPRL